MNYDAETSYFRDVPDPNNPPWADEADITLKDAVLVAILKYKSGDLPMVKSREISAHGIVEILDIRNRSDFPGGLELD